MAWSRAFDEPIPLPRGRELVILEDAGKYITKLPKAEHEAKEWQAAMEALILVATHGGLARIGVMRALGSPRRAGVRAVAESYSLGKAQAGARPLRCAGGDVCSYANNGINADIAPCPSWAKAQSRCAPARCAGARIERPVVEDSPSAGELRPEN